MINIKLNPLWSKTVLIITFGFLLLLSSYILIDPVGSAENLLNIYNFFAVNLSPIFLIAFAEGPTHFIFDLDTKFAKLEFSDKKP